MNSMKQLFSLRRLAVVIGLCVGLAAVGMPAFADTDEAPEVSKDGLHLTKRTKTRLVYVKQGATFSQYKRVAILDCMVQFSEDWVRDYNRDQRDPSRRIGNSDLESAKTSLSAQFKKIFAEELSSDGGYAIADSAGPDVLVLRPALINIAVSAPDLMAPGRSATYVESAGQMTIFLELWDSETNTILARVMDARADPNNMGQRSSSVTNRAAADRLMRSWAKELRGRLDVVSGKEGS
jgi:Protein of unknown function (DUF3313)